MKRFIIAVGVAAIGVVLIPLIAGSQHSGRADAEDPALVRAESEARRALDGFYEAFNAADNDALQKYCNYPHAFVGSNGSVRVIEDRWTMNFERMREGEGWSHSTLESAEAVFVKEDKVHFQIVFSRTNTDGEKYRTMPGLWIMTRQNGQWGLTLRSY